MAEEASATSEAPQTQNPGINDQATLDAAIAAETAKMSVQPEEEAKEVQVEEVKPEKEPEKIDYRTKFSAIKKGYDQLALEKKQLETKFKEYEDQKQFQAMDYDQKLEYIAKENQELKGVVGQLQGALEQSQSEMVAKADAARLEEFLSDDADLSLSPQLQQLFRMVATSTDPVPPELSGGKEMNWNEVNFEDIKTAYFKPMLEKVSGTRVKTRERQIVGKSAPVTEEFTDAAIAKMSKGEYERNKAKILQQYGIKANLIN